MNRAPTAKVPTWPRTSRSRTARTANRTAAAAAAPMRTTAQTTLRTATTGWNPSSGLSTRAVIASTAMAATCAWNSRRQRPSGTPSGNTTMSSESSGRLRTQSALLRRAPPSANVPSLSTARRRLPNPRLVTWPAT